MIVNHDLIKSSVEVLYQRGGLPKGSSTGWPSVDDFYTVGMGQWTLITGTPNSGKSEWADALMVNLAKQEPWKFFIFSPENWPLELHHSKIIEKYIGKPFTPGPTERMNVDEVEEAEEWMRGKFHFCKPDKPEILSIIDEAGKFSVITGAWKTGVVIDPWNQLEHYRMSNQSETEYVSEILSHVIQRVRFYGAMHIWIVAHPAKMQKDRNGNYPVPTPRDVSGSAHFWNKADNCITVHRDLAAGTQDVDIHVQKIRFKHIGRIGVTTLKYDWTTGRYHEPFKAPVVPMRRERRWDQEIEKEMPI